MASLVGRTVELKRLLLFASGHEPLVMYVHGIAGVGKTFLLNALASSVAAKGISAVKIDARWCEPSAAGVCRAISRELGSTEFDDPALVAKRLSAHAKRVLLVIDNYECFRLLDSWMRQTFLPGLGDNIRTVLSSREVPRSAWRIAPAWKGLFDSMLLETFAPEVALEYLAAEGLPQNDARELNRITRGHPLAISLGSALYFASGHVRGKAATHQEVLEHMAALFLDDADKETTAVIEAACVVRTATAPLMAAMLPEASGDESLRRLRALPFVTAGPHGLVVHEAVRAAVTAVLKSRDPGRYQEYRRAASRVVREQYRQAARSDHWRCTADVIYLLENESLREGFFPKTEVLVAVEPARSGDESAIAAIVRRFEGRQATAVMDVWWQHHPDAFFVVRDEAGIVQGFYVAIVAAKVHKNVLARDPLAASWAKELQRNEDRAAALWVRRTLDRNTEERPSPGQAACWLDIKRTYLELRPRLRWIYTCYRDAEQYRKQFEDLGFQLVDEGRPLLDGAMQHTFRLDMGADSVDGWLSNLLARETGTMKAEVDRDSRLLDEQSRELIVNGGRVALTPLEFGVFSYLSSRPNKAVARYELVEAVWGYGKEASTSNVVEAVVRSLRKKLGGRRDALETVRGVGYRYRQTI